MQTLCLQTLHEGFSRNFGLDPVRACSAASVDVKLTSVDQLTYSEFVFSLENPTCFNLLRAEPLEGNLILDINPSILYPIIDRIARRRARPAVAAIAPAQRKSNCSLVSRITGLFARAIAVSALGKRDRPMKLSVELVRVESNPQLVQIVTAERSSRAGRASFGSRSATLSA